MSATNNNSTKPRTRKTSLAVEALERRDLMATLSPIVVKPISVPDYAGSTFDAARVVNLPALQLQKVSDHLAKASDIDMYKVDLNQGDFLAIDVDRTGTASLSSLLAVFNSSGGLLNLASNGVEPENKVVSADPALGFWAPESGSYYLRLTTSATTLSAARGYDLKLQRLGVEDNVRAERLDDAGAYRVWLNGDTLNLTGPTGHGFSLRGAWTKTMAAGVTTYSTTGTVYLKTAALGQYAGEIPLAVSGAGKGTAFSIKANTPGWAELGTLSSVSGQFGFSLDAYAAKIENALGVDLSDIAVANGWTIKTGAQIKAQYQNYVQREIAQILDGVPYLVYGAPGDLNLRFGNVSLTSTDQASLVIIADPADPFLYVGYKDYAFAGSMHGNIPFNTSVTPPSASSGAITQVMKSDYFGHVYAAGEFPLKAYPISLSGDVTVDLDANDDGMFLAGAGNAHQLFKGDLSALGNVVKDINVGVNGAVNFAYKIGDDYQVTVPLGTASVFYSGSHEAVWFEGKQGVAAVNPWQGTILQDFNAGPGTTIKGHVYSDGRFSVSNTTTYQLMKSLRADLTLTISNDAITAQGTVKTPIATLDVSGAIGFSGNFSWTGAAHIDVGTSNNYLRGDASFSLIKTGGKLTATLTANAQARIKISGAKAQGKVTGAITVTAASDGSIRYSADLKFDGDIYYWNAVVQGWRKLGSFQGSFKFDGANKLSFKAFGRTFSISLP